LAAAASIMQDLKNFVQILANVDGGFGSLNDGNREGAVRMFRYVVSNHNDKNVEN